VAKVTRAICAKVFFSSFGAPAIIGQKPHDPATLM